MDVRVMIDRVERSLVSHRTHELEGRERMLANFVDKCYLNNKGLFNDFVRSSSKFGNVVENVSDVFEVVLERSSLNLGRLVAALAFGTRVALRYKSDEAFLKALTDFVIDHVVDRTRCWIVESGCLPVI